MRGKMVLLAGMMVLFLGLAGAPASWANSLTYQDVTFNMNLNLSGNLELNVVNALNASGDWTGIDVLHDFQINNYGTASGLSVTGWDTVPGGSNSSGCDGSGSGTCFSFQNAAGYTLTNNFTLEIVKTSGTFDLTLLDPESGLPGPHLKVLFGGADGGNDHGNLLSQTVTVPVPGTVLMFGLGFAFLIAWYQWYQRPAGMAGASA